MSAGFSCCARRSVQLGLLLIAVFLGMLPGMAQAPAYQPDVIARNYGESASVGDNLYQGADGQTVTQEAPTGLAAVFYLKIENDGASDDTFLVTGPAGGSGWTVRYFNRMLGGTDVTDAVTTGGLTTAVVEPGDYLRFRVEVTLDETVPVGVDVVTAVTAQSTNDSAFFDTARLVTQKLPLQAVRLTADPCTGIPGQPVTLEAESLGGYQVQYRFFIYDGSCWTTIRPYDLDPTCTTVPEKIGKYQLLVWAREVGSSQQKDCYATGIYKVVAPPVEHLTLTATPEATVVGRPICLTATSECLGTVLYSFYVKTATGWECLQSYSPDSTCDAVSVPRPGAYTFSVLAREVDSTREFDAEAQVDVSVNPPLCGVRIETCPVSPQPLGTQIGIRATTNGGAMLLYQLLIDGVAISNYTPRNEWVWRATSIGGHTIRVNVREYGSPHVYDVTSAINYSILAPASEVSLAYLPEHPVVGRPLTLKATGDGLFPMEYRFFVYDGHSWVAIRPYSADRFCTVTPTRPGPCTFLAWGRAIGSPQQQDCHASVNCMVAPPLTAVRLDGVPPSPVSLGTDIHLRAVPNGGGTVEYAYFLGFNGQWTPLRAYSPDPLFNTVGDAVGDYRIAVWAREVGSPNAKDCWAELPYTVIAPRAYGALLTIEPCDHVAPGAEVRLVAECQAEPGAILGYRFFAYNRTTGVSETIQPYGLADTCVTTVPSIAGDYMFTVWVRDVRGTRQWDCFATANICVGDPPAGAPLTGVTLAASPAETVPLGMPITLTATPQGGVGVQYRFFVYNGTTWETLRDYALSPTLITTPPSPGLYKFVVWARAAGSTERWDYFAVKDVLVTGTAP